MLNKKEKLDAALEVLAVTSMGGRICGSPMIFDKFLNYKEIVTGKKL